MNANTGIDWAGVSEVVRPHSLVPKRVHLVKQCHQWVVKSCQNTPMELNNETLNVALKDAASLVLLRERAVGLDDPSLEVFLLKRHSASKVLGGAYVFPGGKLDAQDLSAMPRGLVDQDGDVLHAQLAEQTTSQALGVALFVAALREAYEECGVLWIKSQDGLERVRPWVKTKDDLRALTKSGVDFLAALERLQLQLDTQALVPWSRWITPQRPTVSTQRFDARFFLGLLPELEEAAHDQIETTHSAWFTPQEALQAYVRGDIELAAPQIMCLLELKQFKSARAAWTAAKHAQPLFIEPQSLDDHGRRGVCFPGDELHPVKVKALSGPTRLWFSNGQFQPESGLDSLTTHY